MFWSYKETDLFYNLQINVHNILQVILWRRRMFWTLPFSSSSLVGCLQVVAIMSTEPLVWVYSKKCNKWPLIMNLAHKKNKNLQYHILIAMHNYVPFLFSQYEHKLDSHRFFFTTMQWLKSDLLIHTTVTLFLTSGRDIYTILDNCCDANNRRGVCA